MRFQLQWDAFNVQLCPFRGALGESGIHGFRKDHAHVGLQSLPPFAALGGEARAVRRQLRRRW
jgi:hypothetical protein